MSDSAAIFVFPHFRRHSLVEETATLVALKSAPAATRFYHLTMRRLAGQMQALGVAESVIDIELRQFAAAVFDRLNPDDWDDVGGDAA